MEIPNLRLVFARQSTPQATPPDSSRTALSAKESEISQAQDEASKDSLEKDELAFRDEQIHMALLENPQEAEQMLLDEELEELEDADQSNDRDAE